jgi:hypothetical protein
MPGGDDRGGGRGGDATSPGPGDDPTGADEFESLVLDEDFVQAATRSEPPAVGDRFPARLTQP